MSLLTIDNLNVYFETELSRRFAVKGVSFELARGETLALVGESGCGKSMTAYAITQLLPPAADINESATIEFDGIDLLGASEIDMQHIRGKRISMIFQEPMTSLNPVLTIGEQLTEVLRQHAITSSEEETYKRAIELFRQVGLSDVTTRYHSYPHQLSGGMKQRAMIAMAIATNPDLLIADEPTTALDVTVQAQILQLLQELQAQLGMALLLITHDLGIVRQVADRVGVMYAGHMIEIADVEVFFKFPYHPYSQQLLAALPDAQKRQRTLPAISGNVLQLQGALDYCRFANRCHYAISDCQLYAPRILALNNHYVRCHRFDPNYAEKFPIKLADEKLNTTQEGVASIITSTDEAPVLVVKHLSHYFPIKKGFWKRKVGDVYAVNDINFSLHAGKTLAIVGESGCGKTTVAKAVMRLLAGTVGSIRFLDQEVLNGISSMPHALRRMMQMVFQDPFSAMNPRFIVHEIIAEGLRVFEPHMSHRDRVQRVVQFLQQVGLPEEAQWRYPHEFSGGQRQRIAIARSLAVGPKVVVWDEPTSALDVSVQAQILNLLKELQRQHQLSYLFITHNMAVVAYLADEVAVMYLGKIVEIGPVENVLTEPKHPYTQLLLSAIPEVNSVKALPLTSPIEPPSPSAPPTGCHFHTRCPHVLDKCKHVYPQAVTFNKTHAVHCHLYAN